MPKDKAVKPEPSPFEKMRTLAQQVVSTPKEKADANDREWKAEKNAKRTA